MNAPHRVAIAGVGYSQVGRRLDLSDDEMVRQAVTAALEDAGMTTADVDGISTMGGNAMQIGFNLGMGPLSWYFTSPGGPAFVEPAVHAISCVASGMSTTCVRVVRVPAPASWAPRCTAATRANPSRSSRAAGRRGSMPRAYRRRIPAIRVRRGR